LTALYGVPMRRLAFEHEGQAAEALIPVWLDAILDPAISVGTHAFCVIQMPRRRIDRAG
jgi:hypothetical protein